MDNKSNKNSNNQDNYIDGTSTPQSSGHESRFNATNSVPVKSKDERKAGKPSKSKRLGNKYL